jgi:pyrimidine deaminase RibD-like protein
MYNIKKIVSIAYYHACQHITKNTRCSHHCCVIFKYNKIVTVQTNRADGHAELWAINNIFDKEEPPCDILVIRVSADNSYRIVNSKPCINCAQAMKNLNLRYIYFSNDDGEIVREPVSTFTSQHIPRKQIHLSRIKKN